MSRQGKVSQSEVSVTVPGVTLRGDRWDPPAGVDRLGAVVLAHGGGQTRHSWRRTGEEFAARGWASLAYDARGHGDSDWSPDGVYTTAVLSADLRAVVETLDEPPVVMGASMGGTSAMVLAGSEPDTVRGLVLVDVAPLMEQTGTDRITAFMAAGVDGFQSVEEAGLSVQAYNPHRPPSVSWEGLRKNLRLRDDGRWYWHWDPAFLALGSEPAAGERFEAVAAAAASISVPTMLVRGSKSDVVTARGVDDFLGRVPHARVVQVSAGHMVVGDDNSVFTEEIETFLASLPAEESDRGSRAPAQLKRKAGA